MSFERRAADNWRRDVPGARWFKADLHIHTIDDHPGKRAKMPDGLTGDPADPETLARYARRFLKALIARGVQVAGLTPHSPRAGAGPETSAVWRIVDEWNDGTDDDGILFREKVYAVFPGFEPSFKEGREGLHLLFLFDPEIGREHYLRAFDLAMDGISPWRGAGLHLSGRRADDAFKALRQFRERECPGGAGGVGAWDTLVLAPHIDSPKGLLGAQKAQVLRLFEHEEIAGLELGDEKLPDDTFKTRPWLRKGMEDHRQAFFHASDAYSLDEPGRRHCWMKLASPRIAALRQAFIASDSRMRIGFEKSERGGLRPIDDPPDVTLNERPWLREITVRGGASFFGGRHHGKTRETRFRLSPDLTCIIGGSMTGKSTLLDGLRIETGARLPDDTSVRFQVEARGRHVFGLGGPEIAWDCPGSDSTAPLRDRWPARFFAQNELQRLSRDGAAVEEILARLVSSETEGIRKRGEMLRNLDDLLAGLAGNLARLDEKLADAEQACQRANEAKRALAAFSEAGVDRLHVAARERQAWEAAALSASSGLFGPLGSSVALAGAVSVPPIGDALRATLAAEGFDTEALDPEGRWAALVTHIEKVRADGEDWIGDVREIAGILKKKEANLRADVERALAERGLDAAMFKEFQALDRQASLLPSYEDALYETRTEHADAEKGFARLRKERAGILEEQRLAFDRATAAIAQEFGNRIRVRRVENGDSRPLERFLEELRQRGVTRWWNGLEDTTKPSPEGLIACLDEDSLADVGMSDAVRATFREAITKSRKRELAALRCPDRYVLELRMDDGGYRPLDELSGGQRVSVLLSLLLEAADDRPLVIDQPEDELDNRFLFDTVLPALKKLRGRRQVIVATHNANIVVNGDADMAIQLEATANRGRIACAGAIEEPAVRDAIVRTVDGGQEAFRLRRRKYGF